jgi:hypothetical protein
MLFILLLIAGGALGAVGSFWWSARWYPDDVVESEYASAEGWHWFIAPAPWPESDGIRSESGGVLVFSENESPERSTVVLSVLGVTPEKPEYEYRLVEIDASGDRGSTVSGDLGGTGGGVAVHRFTLSGNRSLSKVGIEYRTKASRADG